MPKPIVDLAELDLSQPVMAEAELRRLLPHRHEFQMIDAVAHLDVERGIVVGYKDVRTDDWWTRGHIPGRPIVPGVLMMEGCAQISTILIKTMNAVAPDRFIGLGGVDDARFRGTVVPPARIWFVSEKGQLSSRLARYPAQAFVDGRLVMEMSVLGVLL
jgi:3-hydroxyacyl-[acyl-carrier-protein] dehydratase